MSPWGLHQLSVRKGELTSFYSPILSPPHSMFIFCLGILTSLLCLLLQLCSHCRTWCKNSAGSWYGNSAGAFLTSTVWRVTSFWITQHKADGFCPARLFTFPIPLTGIIKYTPPSTAFGDLSTKCPRVECFPSASLSFPPKKAWDELSNCPVFLRLYL